MSLFWIIQIVSVVGVATVIALTWAVGWGRKAKIASVDAAAARFTTDFPSAQVTGGAIAKDGRAAVLDLGQGFGLVTVLGDELVTRKLRAGEITAGPLGNELVLSLNDVTLAKVRIALDKDELSAWLSRLASPLEGEAGSPSEPGGGSPSTAQPPSRPSVTLPLKGGGEMRAGRAP